MLYSSWYVLKHVIQLKMLHMAAALYLDYFKIIHRSTKQLEGTKNEEHQRKYCV